MFQLFPVESDLPGFVHCPHWGADDQRRALEAIRAVIDAAPLYTPTMPRTGKAFSVRMTNCGALGWVSDRDGGYRYQPTHPMTWKPWPPIPDIVLAVWEAVSGYTHPPEACLINYYVPGAKLGLHQDRDENDAWAPIVSVSLGLPAVFLWGGKRRADPVRRLRLEHGDVVVWGGPARFVYHGVAPLKDGDHPLTGGARINVTFRKVF